ncbi:uncharacterized protein N7469_007942 [Penicillium citrinum]|uniref:Uncharacterized protein n=2 Tax=Penicillium TaxID=5073 RepID=A0A9W9NTP4_PENCI|nr:uncharacterized protein N7469_007942 [Penicillium citrinum]KAJ5224439.1 hypothetical protein N7469_007942 [Penicillium citrinum]KAJ5574691.1 hypothetical protein N7450_008590 [Penicillium hetheringtonii]
MAKPAVTPRSLQTRISHLLKHWPSDAVRPASVSVQTYLQSHLGQKQTNGSPQEKDTRVPKPHGELSESSVNAMTSLLNDRFARRYPLSQKVRYPASDPDHYDNLIREFEEAPNRDWLGRLKKRLGGILRLS